MIAQLALVIAAAWQSGSRVPSPADLGHAEEIDRLFAEATDEDSPGFAVLVVKDGNQVHARGYGLADLKRRTPMGPDVAVRLGSVSKQFTAMAIMILRDRELLDFDDPATECVPELSERYGARITIRHLLNHTSGLPDYYGPSGKSGDLFETEDMPRIADGAAVFAKWGEARFAPGARFEYSNPGYEMLGLIVERLSGKSFVDFLDEAIFEPLGMHGSFVMDRPDVHFEGRAYGYSPEGDTFQLNDDHRLNLMFGAGGVYSTLEDMFAWDQALYTEKLVSAETWEQAVHPAWLANGKESNYGFGWMLSTYRGHRRIQHGGSWVGFRTAIVRYPERQLTVVVLSNRSDGNPGSYLDPIADLFL